MSAPVCTLCEALGGTIVWEDARCRVVLVDEPDFPGFCRVIWRAHVAEMTDLAAEDRAHLMNVVWRTEAALRTLMQPAKINLASLGNIVPHVHWHVIARFLDDSHFPQPIWASPQRTGARRQPPAIDALRAALAADGCER